MSAADSGLRVVLLSDAAGEIVPVADETLRSAGHRLVGVLTSPGPRKRRGTSRYLDLVAAARPGIDVLVSNHPSRWAAMLAPLRPDVVLSTGFLWVIPDDLLALPRLGAINTHGGLLPHGRGPNPVGWAFRRDEGVIGWTAHRLTPQLDAGPILAQAAISYGDDDFFADLFQPWTALIPGLWLQALERLSRGEPGEPQVEADAYYAGSFEPEWRFIDWSRPAREIHNQVRSWLGVRGVPEGAIGEIEGVPALITRTRLLDESTTAPPGTVLNRGETLLVQCADRALEIVRWQPVASG